MKEKSIQHNSFINEPSKNNFLKIEKTEGKSMNSNALTKDSDISTTQQHDSKKKWLDSFLDKFRSLKLKHHSAKKPNLSHSNARRLSED